MKLVEHKGLCETSRTCLKFNRAPEKEEWKEIGRELKSVEGSVMWWVGDWYNAGPKEYGDLKALAEEIGFEYQTVKNAAQVCKKVLSRVLSLTFAHHLQVASLPPASQRRILEEAEAGGLSVRDTRRLVRLEKARLTYGSAGSPSDFGDNKYRIIYADPPWSYGNEMTDYATTPQDHYVSMSTEDIKALPVEDLSLDNSVLFLWSTCPHLVEALGVMEAWGFEYKTQFVWDKIKHNMGHYNSVRHEILLIGVKGSCTPDVQKLHDSVQSIERTEHSKKPERFREIIDEIYTAGSRIELFARKSTDNWSVWGNEIPGRTQE